MISEIILLRSIGILLVVFGHADIYGQASPPFYTDVEKYIYSFHMPLFMFISGFVFMYTSYESEAYRFTKFFKKKISRLLVPAFFVLTIAFIVRTILGLSKDSAGVPDTIATYFKMFFLKHYLPIEYFWYIFTLFNIFLLSALILYCFKNQGLIILTSIVVIVLSLHPIRVELFYIRYTTKYLIFFYLGTVCCFIRNKISFSPWLRRERIVLFLSFLFLSILIQLNRIEIGTEIGDIFSALFGILMCITCVQYVNQFRLEYLRTIGKYSYQIFLLSWFFHRIVETVGYKKLEFNFWITFPLSFTSAILGPILLARLMEKKIPKTKYLIGL